MIFKNSVHLKMKQNVVQFRQVRIFFLVDKIFTQSNNYVNDLLLAVAPITEAPIDNAQRCNPAECELPYCFCSKDGASIPKDLNPEEVS